MFEIEKDLYGIKNIDSLGKAEGTLWWTFYALPVVPVATYYIQLFHPEHDILNYELLEKKSLDYYSVFKTYLNTVLVLMLLFWPWSLSFAPTRRWFRIPDFSDQGFMWFIIGCMLWSAVVVVSAEKFHIRSGTPSMLIKPHDPTEWGIWKRVFIVIWIFLMAVLAGVFVVTNTGPFPLLVKIQRALGFFNFEVTFMLLMIIEALVCLALYVGYSWLAIKIRALRGKRDILN